MYLLTDASYYHLPRLMHQLANTEIFIRIGYKAFRIPRDIFSCPGDTPNFFTVGFRALFGATGEIPTEKGLVRPPPIAPPLVPNRSGDLFEDLLKILRGSHFEITNEDHRQKLLTECRYYRFRGLEQKIIAHEIRTNRGRDCEEIVLNLGDIKPTGLEVGTVAGNQQSLFYKRPFVDSKTRELIIQIQDCEDIILHQNVLTGSVHWEMTMCGKTKDNMNKLLTTKLQDKYVNMGDNGYIINLDSCNLVVDGNILEYNRQSVLHEDGQPHPLKRTKIEIENYLYIQKAQMRAEIKDNVITLHLLKAVGYSNQTYNNSARRFI